MSFSCYLIKWLLTRRTLILVLALILVCKSFVYDLSQKNMLNQHAREILFRFLTASNSIHIKLQQIKNVDLTVENYEGTCINDVKILNN